MKRISIVAASLMLLISLCSCGNRSVFDSTYTFNRAIIQLPDGEIINGKVTSWRDFEDGDQLQITIDGVTYLTHSSNVCLISEN